jgi:hypothetical protein
MPKVLNAAVMAAARMDTTSSENPLRRSAVWNGKP